MSKPNLKINTMNIYCYEAVKIQQFLNYLKQFSDIEIETLNVYIQINEEKENKND